jgi:FlaG/FlaF family flagellin (archaellin)
MKHLAIAITITIAGMVALFLMGYFTGWHVSRHSIPNGALFGLVPFR